MNRLSALRSLALPLHTAPLLLVVIFSLLLAFAVQAGLWGLPMLVIIGSWFFKYAFVLLDHAAEGRPGAPVLSAEDANPAGERRPLAYGLLIALFYAATAAMRDVVGQEFVSGLRLLALAALPAILATQVVTGSLASALNPLSIATMLRRLGIGYAVIAAVAVGCWWLGRAIVLDTGRLALLVQIASLMLLWLALFSVLGGVIHARRFQLGFEPEHSPERRQNRLDAERDRLRDRFIDQVFAEYRSGSSRNAWESIKRRAQQSPSALTEYLWIYDRVAGWPEARLANRVAQAMLPLLLAARRNGEALAVAKGRLQADADFRPLTSAQLIRLAELARDGGDRPLGRALLADFDRHYPGDAARNTARLLGEQLAR